MVILKYEKTGAAVYLPHLDAMRALMRTLRRACIPVEYSRGFNPHMLIFLSQPLPLGLPSLAEYAVVHTDVQPDEVLKRYNAYAVPGLLASRCAAAETNPNIAAIAVAADYSVTLPGECVPGVLEFLSKVPTLEYVRNGKPVTDGLAGKLLGAAKAGGNGLTVRGGVGNNNLRMDRLSDRIEAEFKLPRKTVRYVRTALLYRKNDTLSNIDELTDMWYNI